MELEAGAVNDEQDRPSVVRVEFDTGKRVPSGTAHPTKRFPRAQSSSRFAVMGTFVLAAVAFLYFARIVFLPIVLAILLSFFLKPIVKWLARVNIPPSLGAALVLVVMLLAIGNGISRLAKPAADFVVKLPDNLRHVEQKARRFLQHAERMTRAAAQVEDMTIGNPADTPASEIKLNHAAAVDGFFSRTTAFLAGSVETLVLLYFILAHGEKFLQKLIKVLPSFHEKRRAAKISHEVQQHISSFLFTVTVINAGLGALVAVGVWLAGLSNPILWGLAAGLLNFIPYFGPVVGVCILALAGTLTFDSTARALLPPFIYLGLHVLEANFITPLILGRRLTLNPVVIFVSFMFWTWLWGIPGALLAVPLLMTFKIFCDHFKSLGPIGEFVSG